MNQRQLNMLQAIEDGIKLAKTNLQGPGAESCIREALETVAQEEPISLGLAHTAYLACCVLAWKERGCPDLLK